MQLMVIKADGSREQYLHTKVIAAFVNALAQPCEKNTFLASQLAESVTFYLYNTHGSNTVGSGEILSIIKAVLSSTGFDYAADVLTEHYHRRNLLRARLEVIKMDTGKTVDVAANTNRWNKSKIVSDLLAEQNLDIAAARTIASLVEEKMLNSGFRIVPTNFIKFLVISQMNSLLSAKPPVLHINYNAVTDDRLRQPQNGLCSVEV